MELVLIYRKLTHNRIDCRTSIVVVQIFSRHIFNSQTMLIIIEIVWFIWSPLVTIRWNGFTWKRVFHG